MKIRSLVFAFTLLLPAAAVAEDQSKQADESAGMAKEKAPTKLSDAEVKIVAHAHHVNVMEVDFGKLAQKSGTAPVKRYGEMLVRDHQTSDKELASLAKKHGIAKLPMPKQDQLSETEKQDMKAMKDSMANLKKLKGADFDREFLRIMVQDHDKEVAKTDQLLALTNNDEIKSMLETRKTMLQRHSDQAKELQKGSAQARIDESQGQQRQGNP